MQVKIRPAAQADAPTAVDLMAQLGQVGHGHVDPGVDQRLRAMIDSPDYANLIAEDQAGRVVGLLSASRRWTLWHAGPCALIEELVVDEAARGQGIGRALIEACLAWARAERCSEVEVSTDVDNTDAQAFYRRLGFESEAMLLEYELD